MTAFALSSSGAALCPLDQGILANIPYHCILFFALGEVNPALTKQRTYQAYSHGLVRGLTHKPGLALWAHDNSY
jgi:hypothetical protein